MTTQQIREGFDRMIEAAAKVDDKDAVSRMELAREYYTNPTFKAALEDHLWRLVAHDAA